MQKNYLLKRGEKLVRNMLKVDFSFNISKCTPYPITSMFVVLLFLLSTLSFIMLLSTPVLASHGQNCMEITNRKPIFQINFDEPSMLSLFELTAIKGNTKTLVPIIVPELSTNFSTYYEASVDDILDASVKDYILKLNATDQFDNEKVYEQCYHYVPRATRITLAEPEFGYSPVKPFTAKIKTDAYAICKYSINTDLGYYDENPAKTMVNFKETGYSLEHIVDIKAELFPDNLINTVVKLFVKCNRTDGELNDRSEMFELRLDTSKPVIKEVRISPQASNIISNEPLQTTLIVTTDEAARCKYSLTEVTDYNLMESKFDNFLGFSAASGSITNSLNFARLDDKKDYKFKIACENKAKLISNIEDFSFKVDKSADDIIIVNKPNGTYISKIPVELEVFTNRDAECIISTPPAPGSALQTSNNNLLIHKLASISGISSQGKYNFTVHCDFLKPGGSKAPKKQVLNLIYDSQPPEILNFSAINTCMLNELNIKWSAKDTISTITGFLYKITSNTVDLFNWTETTKNEVKINVGKYDLPNISANTKYTITVAGKDSAGNVNKIGKTSQEIKLSDPFAQECLEKIPPKSNITKEFKDNAAFITINCQDFGGSGCNSESYLYNAIDSSASCSPAQKYTKPVKVTNTAIFCWKVSDNAGNTHQGEEKIILTIDTDDDGIPDSMDKCSNTIKTEKADSTGCSESQKDDDNDGIPNNKDICPETLQEAIDTQTINSSGCEKDSDNDGMPDYWELKYKFDINDPSDALKNPDLDGANNLQEYRQGTNPLVSDVDPGQLPDKDGDGVPDTLDKCPETVSGEAVNPQTGCSKKDLDKDEDGMSNECEKKYGLDSENPDDAEQDLDGDGLTNLEECEYENCELELDPKNADTDGDGYSDGNEKDAETNPCNAEDKPASVIVQFILLAAGILFLFAGIGYLAYKRFVLKESLSSSEYWDKTSKEYKIGSLGYPQSTKTISKQESKAGAQPRQLFAKKQLTLEEKRRAALQKIKEERKQRRTKELTRAFSGFGAEESSKDGSEIKKIEMPARKKHRIEARGMTEDVSRGIAHTYLIHPVKKASTAIKNIILPEETSTQAKELSSKEKMRSSVKTEYKKSLEYKKIEELAKSNTAITKLKSMTKSATNNKSIKEIINMPMAKLKGLLSTSTDATLESLTKKELPIEQLKKYTINKADIKKIVEDGKQEKQAKKIFDELAAMNKENNQKAEAFTKLSLLMKGWQDIDKKDVFKELPKKLVPETSKEAEAFTKLNNILEGKPVDDGIKELSKLRAKKINFDYLKMLAGKK